jgi:hypothetical protein
VLAAPTSSTTETARLGAMVETLVNRNLPGMIRGEDYKAGAFVLPESIRLHEFSTAPATEVAP